MHTVHLPGMSGGTLGNGIVTGPLLSGDPDIGYQSEASVRATGARTLAVAPQITML
jgi:hypothetical protein